MICREVGWCALKPRVALPCPAVKWPEAEEWGAVSWNGLKPSSGVICWGLDWTEAEVWSAVARLVVECGVVKPRTGLS